MEILDDVKEVLDTATEFLEKVGSLDAPYLILAVVLPITIVSSIKWYRSRKKVKELKRKQESQRSMVYIIPGLHGLNEYKNLIFEKLSVDVETIDGFHKATLQHFIIESYVQNLSVTEAVTTIKGFHKLRNSNGQ